MLRVSFMRARTVRACCSTTATADESSIQQGQGSIRTWKRTPWAAAGGSQPRAGLRQQPPSACRLLNTRDSSNSRSQVAPNVTMSNSYPALKINHNNNRIEHDHARRHPPAIQVASSNHRSRGRHAQVVVAAIARAELIEIVEPVVDQNGTRRARRAGNSRGSLNRCTAPSGRSGRSRSRPGR